MTRLRAVRDSMSVRRARDKVVVTSVAAERTKPGISRSAFLRGSWFPTEDRAPVAAAEAESAVVLAWDATARLAVGHPTSAPTVESELSAARLAATVAAAAMIQAEQTAVEMAVIASVATAEESDAGTAATAAAMAYRSEVERAELAAELMAGSAGAEDARLGWELVAAEILATEQVEEVLVEELVLDRSTA